jgi:glucoamylase
MARASPRGTLDAEKHLAWSHPAFISCVSARRIAAAACPAPRRQ